MLEKLTIKNYLLLRDIEIDMSEGFNIVTGETGAGKSILINALSLLFGDRADYSIIAGYKDKMIIEAVISSKKNSLKKLLKENDIEILPDNKTIIRRELYSKGYSRNFANDSPVNVNILKEIGDYLVDIHSQNEHQSLLRKESHIEILDSYKGTFPEKYFKIYAELQNLNKEFREYSERKIQIEKEKTFIEFQLKELNEADVKVNEDITLENELKTIENSESIQQGLTSAHNNLYEESGSVVEKMDRVIKDMEKLVIYMEEAKAVHQDLNQAQSLINESSRQIAGILNNLNFEPERAEQIRERLYKLQFIKKKYGGNLEEAVSLKNKLESEFQFAEEFDEKLDELKKSISENKIKAYELAIQISKARKAAAKDIEKGIDSALRELGFETAEFKVSFETHISDKEDNYSIPVKNKFIKFTETGFDDVEFLVKVNKGEEFSSLRKTASGGEISRIMLAIKSVLAGSDNVDILVFDEIDTGISGRIAQKAGKLLKKLSSYHQVIAITHLAQIAALGDEHFLVTKEDEGGEKTSTKIRKLKPEEKVIEIAKLLSGEKVTDSSIKSAKELINA